MNRLLFLLVFFLHLFVSCSIVLENSDMESENLVVNDQGLADLLKSSPENVEIRGNKLYLDTYLWRDFMPGAWSGNNGSPLMGSIRFVGQSGDILSNTISISKVYVVNNNKIWACGSFEKRIIENNVFEVVVRNGPEWGPDIHVDVICEFRNVGESFRLKSKTQNINATY